MMRPSGAPAPVPELHVLRPLWLLALPPLAWLWWRLGRHASGAGRWNDLVDAPLRRYVLTAGPNPRRNVRWWLLGAGWLLLAMALAGPAWQREERPVFRLEQARVLVLDLSASMDRADVPPSRLGRARFELLDVLGSLREGSTALIVYGAEPFLVTPLTRDAETIAAQVPVLATDLLPVAGAERADLALDMAGVLLASAGAAAGDVLLISDGIADVRRAARSAARLQGSGHRVSVLGVLPDAAGGSPMADATGAGLGRVAAAGGGRLTVARPDDSDLQALFPEQGTRGAERSRDPVHRSERWRDDGPWLLLALLPIAALAFRRGALGMLPLPLILLVSPPTPVAASGWTDLWLRPDQQALRALEAGDAAAGERFDDPRWRAAALYRSGDYQGALAQLTGQTGAEAHYNRGNVLARLGRYEDAIAEYDAALQQAPDHADARHNRALVRALLAPTLAEDEGSAAGGRGSGGREADGQGSNDRGDGQELDSDALEGGEAASQALSSPLDAGQPGVTAGVGIAAGGPAATRPAPAAGGGSEPPEALGDGPASAAPEPQEAVADAADAPRPGARDAGTRSLSPPAVAAGAGTMEPAGAPAADTAGADQSGSAAAGEVLPPTEALLRQVPDDPAGLLRERFMLQYLRRHGQLY